MDVFTRSFVIGRDENDGEIPSLLEGVRTGKRAALEDLVARVHLRVRVWAARITNDPDLADDVAQEVLIGLERRVQQFDGRSRFSTWLFAVTRNVALTQRRRDERRAALLRDHTAGDVSTQSTDTNTDARALAALALRYLDTLPRKQRMIFELVDVRGMSPADVARELGMEPVTVRSHLFKARRAIRGQLLAHHERMLKEYQS